MHNQPAAISFVWHAAYNNATDTICSSVETVFHGGDSSWFSTERRLRIQVHRRRRRRRRVGNVYYVATAVELLRGENAKRENKERKRRRRRRRERNTDCVWVIQIYSQLQLMIYTFLT